MRVAKTEDAWRRIKELKNYTLRIKSIRINDLTRYADGFELFPQSGLSVFCGRNGVGKSDLLRKIYGIARGELNCGKLVFEHFDKKSNKLEIVNKGTEIVRYIEPSINCSKIIGYLKDTENFLELIEGLEPSAYFSSVKAVKLLSQIVGKNYKSIQLYEIDGAMKDDYTFPYIKVEMHNGVSYSCLEMGMGELLCFYIVWFLQWAEKGSVILIEEIENFLSAYSQNQLINYIADTSHSKSLFTLLTSHSEYILSKFDCNSIFLISQTASGKTKVVDIVSEKTYKDALGIYLRKDSSFIFEDKFAQTFACYIIGKIDISILHYSDLFYSKGGESDLEKVAAHFQPRGNFNHNITCVYDADLSQKVVPSNRDFVSVLALPSVNLLSPEEELWRVVLRAHERVSGILGIDSDSLLEAIHNNGNIDHHDRFFSIANALHKEFNELIRAVIDVWLELEQNLILAKEFVFALSVRGVLFNDFDSAEAQYFSRFEENFSEMYTNLYKDKNNFKVTFDGAKLVFH